MVREIQAKTLLSSVTHPDSLFGIKYTMNLYRGCEHQCIYCDSRSECYQIENFADILVKVNAIELLGKELQSKRLRGTVGTGSMNDPYMPIERRYNLVGRALELIAEHRFGVHVITKGDLVLRDVALLQRIAQVYAAVSFTVTTADDDLARKLEPGAASPSRRFAAMRALADAGIYTGVTLMPVLPFIEDNEDNLAAIVRQARAAGAQYILPGLGMTMRDRQRRYFYDRLDRLFPGLRAKYERAYGERYECAVPQTRRLEAFLHMLCQECGMPTRLTTFTPQPRERKPGESPEQLSLFDTN
jgi:DNA repair photolyase